MTVIVAVAAWFAASVIVAAGFHLARRIIGGAR